MLTPTYFAYRSRVFALTALLWLAATTYADPVHLRITLNGGPVGQNTYVSQPDGTFSSKTEMKVGSLDLSSSIDGHVLAGRLKDYDFEGNVPGAGKLSVVLKQGNIVVNSAGKKTTVPFIDKTGMLFGALHPQFATSVLLAAEKAQRDNPGAPVTTISALMVENSVMVPLKISALASRKVLVAGRQQDVRRFNVRLATLDIEYALDEANDVVAVDVPAQKLRLLADGWDGLFVDPLAKYPELSQPTFKFKTDVGVKTKMRDGVQLVSDVLRPDDNLRHPTILVRTPYGRATSELDGPFWAARGYCYVTQDCRGREDSEGDWDPFVSEGPDGYDTIQWIASQPWSDGKVGMIGGSYAGYVQWAAAALAPPALKCIVPQVSPPDAMHNLPYEYGTFALYSDLWWSKIVAGRHTDLGGVAQLLAHPEKLTTLPLENVDKAVLGQHLEFFSKWLGRDTLGKWKGFDYTTYIGNSKVPALHISGNWDGDGIGTFLNWNAMRKLGRVDQWIIFGPWIHAFNTNHSFGGDEYGPDAILELDSVYLRWFDTWLKGKHVGQKSVPHVKLFVTGANKWIQASQWPSHDMLPRTLYLGKNSLSPEPGRTETESRTYDPAKDTTIPEALKKGVLGEGHTEVTSEALHAPGVMYFYSKPLRKATAITGPFVIQIHFTSSAVNTDFYGSIIDMGPDGRAKILGMAGKLRAAYLEGTDKIRPLKPGKEYVATVVPWEFAHEFPKGHKIGLMILNSMFPIFARNLGTIDPIKTATRMVVQRNKVLMGKGHESSLTFHVLWEK
jgi:putative CocE/NonD family hydrolase